MIGNCLEEDVCLYRPKARWGGEFERIKTLQTTAGELQKIDESRVRKPSAPTSSHVVWEGFKKNDPSSSKNNLQHIQLSDTTGTAKGTGFYGQMKLNNEFFSKHSRWDKNYPMCTMKYTAVFWCCGPIFLLEVLDILFRRMASWIRSNTNR